LPIPDFDETGFLGRKKQASDLLKHVLGPYPVVSLVGDGGIGKTALALKVAYDVLDMPNCPFEAIVWTSSKTTQLTAQEIRRIEGAISDSLGIFNSIAVELAGTVDNPMDEVIEYLGAFKILLIIDNLETVLDEKIRQFLGMLPLGSKVLITSRIGIGAFEYPQKLQAMDQDEAVDLLRAMARVRGVTDLVRLDNAKLVNFCQRMKFNPGYIKWFVSAVQAGTRPEEVLSKPDIFLDFCMSNVYSYLSPQGRAVLRSMLGLPGRHSLAEMAFLNEIEAIDLQSVIYELLRTNMVIMSSTAQGSSFESQYDISDLARAYLSRHHPIVPKESDKLTKRKRQLVAAGEEFQAAQKTDPYSYYTLTIRSRSDFIVAKYLVDALRQSQDNNFPAAEVFIQKARDLAPEYFEVYRMEAIVKVAEGNYSAAQFAYEAAIEIEPLSAPLRKWYGSFLMRYMDNTEESLTQFKKAAELDPNSIEIRLEIARALLYLKEFDQATQRIQELISKLDTRSQNAIKVHDLYLQCFYRKADYLT
jgi:Flp pilus assembly protein TadD